MIEQANTAALQGAPPLKQLPGYVGLGNLPWLSLTLPGLIVTLQMLPDGEIRTRLGVGADAPDAGPIKQLLRVDHGAHHSEAALLPLMLQGFRTLVPFLEARLQRAAAYAGAGRL